MRGVAEVSEEGGKDGWVFVCAFGAGVPWSCGSRVLRLFAAVVVVVVAAVAGYSTLVVYVAWLLFALFALPDW